MSHLLVDISAHGFGHLSQVAPVINRLAGLHPAVRLVIRSGLSAERLRQRITAPFSHIASASDFGYVMHDAVTLDLPATAAAYRAAHAGFPARVAAEARWLRAQGIDAVFANVAYLPLAGAAQAGIPALAMCSLNWADLFEHNFGHEEWAAPIHAEMLDAYGSALFLRVTPGMPMAALDKLIPIGPIGARGRKRRDEIRTKVGAGETARIILIALGGIPMRLPVEDWPVRRDTHYLVPADWQVCRADCTAAETLDLPFVDQLCSVDAIITKPGYGTFAEAAGNGTAVLYPRRDNWPEQDCLIDWLRQYARCGEISAAQLVSGEFHAAIDAVLAAAVPPAPTFTGIEQAAQRLADLLG